MQRMGSVLLTSLLVLLLPLLVAAVTVWFGPTELVACDSSRAMTHFGNVDGPGGPGNKGCLGPSDDSYVLASVLGGLVLIVSTVGIAFMRLTRLRDRRPFFG